MPLPRLYYIYTVNVTLVASVSFFLICLFSNVLNQKIDHPLTMASSRKNLWPKQQGDVPIN